MAMFAKSIQALAVSHVRILMGMRTLVQEAYMQKILLAMRRLAQVTFVPTPSEEKRRRVQAIFMKMA